MSLHVAFLLATLLILSGSVHAQPVRQQRIPRDAAAPRARPAAFVSCLVANCVECNPFNIYICDDLSCKTGYQLSPGLVCNSCAPGYTQNKATQTFTCDKCPPGQTSNGGIGDASKCFPDPSGTTGRRLFETDEDLWAYELLPRRCPTLDVHI